MTPIAMVTGANRGIGYAIAEQLTHLGHTVVLGARNAAEGERAATTLRAGGGQAYAVALDVTNQATVVAAAEWLGERFGRLDVLVNNAGISGPFAQQPSSAEPDLVRAVFDTNFFGVCTVTNALLPLLRRSVAPRIVNVTSGLGSLTRMSDPEDYFRDLPASAAYAPSKTALNALTVQYAKELRSAGFLVNAADPGPCATDFTKHLGRDLPRGAAQGAAVVVKLATLPADGPTGTVHNDEGIVAW